MDCYLVQTKEETLTRLYALQREGENLLEDLKPGGRKTLPYLDLEIDIWSEVNNSVINDLFSNNTVLQQFLETSKINEITGSFRVPYIVKASSKAARRINNQLIALKEIIKEINQGKYMEQSRLLNTSSQNQTLESIINICRNFKHFANSIQRNPHGKANVESVTIRNEYDLQFYFGAILSMHFDDFLPEEPTTSNGGKYSLIDFILKREKIAVELKMDITRAKLESQITTDIRHYKKHKDVENGTIIFFVYDPNRKIPNPVAVENDNNTEDHGSVDVILIISQ
ncbi:hypothetical protein [Cytobacillus sp. IB215665]|uniref:PD-(D/E)XK nuclease domain-containing protein n=1 Tax=Cytobacillus sp. IB215665 TaxID=3097357 RepID=UPI002A0DFE66|nr:hypothetical protein [Cytobacillus sp. IB215665]MDX8367142.1 hypothetical protein [Cytobacillus sp. IB215665]